MTKTNPRNYKSSTEVLRKASDAILHKFGDKVNSYDAARLDTLVYNFTLRVKAPDGTDMGINVSYDFATTKTVTEDETGDVLHYTTKGPGIEMSYQYAQDRASDVVESMTFYLDAAKFLAALETELSYPALIDTEANHDVVTRRLKEALPRVKKKKAVFMLPIKIGPNGVGEYTLDVGKTTWACDVDAEGNVTAKRL